jgi:hypothetical protein
VRIRRTFAGVRANHCRFNFIANSRVRTILAVDKIGFLYSESYLGALSAVVVMLGIAIHSYARWIGQFADQDGKAFGKDQVDELVTTLARSSPEKEPKPEK